MRPISPDTVADSNAADSNAQLPAEYLAWLVTARCVTSYIYKHNINNKLICHHCYLEGNFEEQGNYCSKIRHYIYIGPPYQYELCEICQTSLATSQRTDQCNVCRHEIIIFMNYLRDIGEAPYLTNQPTILIISQSDW